MATQTPNLGLKKPEITDTTGATITNEQANADVLDALFGATSGHDHTGAVGKGPLITIDGLKSGLLGLNVKAYGAKGDGVTDDTTAIQDALNDAATKGAVVFFPGTGATYRITGGLTVPIGVAGVLMERTSHSTGSRLLVDANNITAITVNGFSFRHVFSLTVVNNGRTGVNGILLQNPAGSIFQLLRAVGFDGFGVKINKSWDCVFESISVEQCGGATEYAFSMNDDGDTCNTTHILRLQVEKANKKAIYVSPNSLSVTIDQIHSEQATPDVAYNTWHLGGNRCVYNTARLSANAPATDAKVFLDAADTTFINLIAEDNIPVVANAWSGTRMTLLHPWIPGTLSEQAEQTGTIVLLGGVVNSLTLSPRIIAVGTRIGTKSYGLFGPIVALSGTATSKGVSGGEATLAANAQATLSERLVGGLLIIRNITDGATAVFLLDETGFGSTKLGGAANIVLGDPGAGTNNIGVIANTTETSIINRFTVAKTIGYTVLSVQGGV